MTALSSTTLRSASRASSSPPATAKPLTAAISGLESCKRDGPWRKTVLIHQNTHRHTIHANPLAYIKLNIKETPVVNKTSTLFSVVKTFSKLKTYIHYTVYLMHIFMNIYFHYPFHAFLPLRVPWFIY